MLYRLLKIYVRFAIRLFCHSIVVNKKLVLHESGPLLIASNHPNSFLDAVIFDILFQQPIWSLTRGDVFKSGFITRLLNALKMMPVYRIREGSDNLNANYQTFDNCMQVFSNKCSVLIFSEGLCINEWHLRPLKKGTARLAFKAWSEGIPLKVLPTGINYSSFIKYGKKIIINFGAFIEQKEFADSITDGERNTRFNSQLYRQLQPLVYEIGLEDTNAFDEKFGYTSPLLKIVLTPFACVGFLLHAPLYFTARYAAKKLNKGEVHYDSMLFAILLFAYPVYLAFAVCLSYLYVDYLGVIGSMVVLPFTAFCCARYEIRKG